MKTIQHLTLGLALLCGTVAFGQDRGVTLKVGYSVAIPTGSFRTDISNKTSFLGFNAELMFHPGNKFAVGVETGSQDFYQKFPRQLYKNADGSDVSAVLSNSLQTVPLLVKAEYHFLPTSAIRPYVAVAAGGNIISYTQYAGSFTNDAKNKFGFAARPEAGLYVPLGKYSRTGFSLGAGYNYMPFNYNGINNVSNFTARAGITIGLD